MRRAAWLRILYILDRGQHPAPYRSAFGIPTV